jgi:hypothetical protein
MPICSAHRATEERKETSVRIDFSVGASADEDECAGPDKCYELYRTAGRGTAESLINAPAILLRNPQGTVPQYTLLHLFYR